MSGGREEQVGVWESKVKAREKEGRNTEVRQENWRNGPGKDSWSLVKEKLPEPVFLNVYGAQESIPRNAFRQPM
jgi:hypothetical protein